MISLSSVSGTRFVTFWGRTKKKQDVEHALELATTCLHPDAQWLTGVCAGKREKSSERGFLSFQASRSSLLRMMPAIHMLCTYLHENTKTRGFSSSSLTAEPFATTTSLGKKAKYKTALGALITRSFS